VKRISPQICANIVLVLLLGMAVTGVAQQKPAAPEPKSAVPFIENDYARALTDAQKRNVQLFVDLWAPW
jgi:hypothetical protein